MQTKTNQQLKPYNTNKWHVLSKEVRAGQYDILDCMCYMCRLTGLTRSAEEADHMWSVQQQDDLTAQDIEYIFYDSSNISGICKEHHSRMSAYEDHIQAQLRKTSYYTWSLLSKEEKRLKKTSLYLTYQPQIGNDGWPVQAVSTIPSV